MVESEKKREREREMYEKVMVLPSILDRRSINWLTLTSRV